MSTPKKEQTHVRVSNISLSGAEKIGLIHNFATMLSSGIPILETVDSLLEDAKGNQRKLLLSLRDDLNQGNHVYTSFAKFPMVFDKVTVNIIKASEQAGNLDVALKDLKANIQKQMEFSDKIRGALMYPVFIMFVFVAVMVVILVFVVPRISSVFLRMNVDLPLPTRVLIFASNALLTYSIPISLGLVLIGVGFFFAFKRNKRIIINILSSLPVISELVKQIDITSFTRSLYLLLSSGIPITTALELTEEVVMKKNIGRAIHHTHDIIVQGRRLSEGFREAKDVFPGIMIKITEAGEKSGSLDKSMQEVSEFMDYQVSKTLDNVTALLEPIMLVMVGVMIGGMMMAIIAPIYSVISQVGGK